METLTVRNPRLVALALMVIVVAGLSAFLTLGRQEDPTITNINAVVTTAYPGADPARVETLVTRPIEEELRQIPEINVISSTSAEGISIVSIELQETVDPGSIEQIWSETRDAVADAALAFPAGALQPEVDSDRLGAYAAIVALTAETDAPNPAILARYGDLLAERLRNTPGAKLVTLYGEATEEILVEIDPAASAALGLTPDAISAAIAQADAKVRSGRAVGSGQDILLDVSGDFETLDRVREVVLAEDGRGNVTRLGDIAEVRRAVEDPAASVALSNGQPAIVAAVMVEDGLRIDQWMGWLQEDLDAFRADLPASLTLTQVFDQSEYTDERLAEVATNMGIGIALVVAVLLVTLGVRAALIVALVLPVVSLATIASMSFIGLPIHQMSVTGIIVALGLLVDAAIVMTDEIRQRLGRGLPRLEAVSDGVRRLAAPLLASTVTTALSFVPMILLPGPAGDFVGSIAIAVVLMLAWSLIVALTITPAIAGRFLAANRPGGIRSGRTGRILRASLEWSVRNPLKSIALALVLPVTGFASFGTLTAQFFPGVDRDQFHIEVELQPGTALSETRAVSERIDAALAATPGIETVVWVIGESAPAFYYNIVGSRENEPAFAQALVTTESAEATAALLTPLQAELDASFPEARILVRGLVQGPPVDAPVEFRIVGADLETLRETGDAIRDVLLGVDRVASVRADYEGGAPKLAVDVDEDAARLVGLDLGSVARQLEATLDGATGGSVIEAGEELPVRVRLAGDLRTDPARIATLDLVGPGGAVPLDAVASLRYTPSDAAIVRRNGERVNTVQAFTEAGALPEEVLADARAALDAAGFALPAGYRLEIGGDSDARNDVVSNLLAPIGLIVTLSIATVVMTFNSFRLTAVTFLVAGLAAGLSILSLAVFDYPFGINAVIGVIGSIGVSINAAIIILTGLQNSPDASAGDPSAMAEVVMGSSRHITSTTLTTAGGFLPLILGGGGFWPPFAMAIAGGVLLSTVVSFYFTPQMFALVRPRKAPEAVAEPAPGVVRLAAE
ncbi:MAG: efflux RND transporter permease subunit [Paracoccaceae bacterium]|nr:efflux RND transporter permease subunit [Paracoccaceae bacterium]